MDQIGSKRIFFGKNDPTFCGTRNSDMLIAVDPKREAIVSPITARAAKSACARSGKTRRIAVNSEQDRARSEAAKSEPDWVALMALVRDDQNREAFAELFRHFAPRVKAFLIKSGTDAALAEECAQDVMATLWRKAHLFDPTRASVATWIYTIARNRRIDVLRKQRRPEPEELPWGPQAEPDQEDTLTLQQESEKLRAALKELPDAQKQLIERAYFGDLSHSEIAAETGLPLGTIKSRIRLALDRLRHAMK